MYKCYTSVLREGIIPTAYDKLPDFNRGFISEGSCAQAELALLTLIERELRERSVLFCCMVDIKKVFSAGLKRPAFFLACSGSAVRFVSSVR